MPPAPRWYADLPRIRRVLEALPPTQPTTLDRDAIQKLFRIKDRQANNIMSRFKGARSGSGSTVLRSDLIERLDEMAGPRGIAHAEIQKKVRTEALIDKLERETRPKKINRPLPKPVGVALPEGVVQFAPGEVLIKYTNPEEFLSRIAALAKSATSDFASFDAGLEYPSARNGDCTVDK